MNKEEIYLSDLEWTKTHDNMGGVMGNVVFKNNMPYEEYNKLFKSGYFILCDKDYITNLQKRLDFMIDRNDEKQDRIDKAIEYIEISMNNPQPFYEYLFGDDDGNVENLDKLLNILKGDE